MKIERILANKNYELDITADDNNINLLNFDPRFKKNQSKLEMLRYQDQVQSKSILDRYDDIRYNSTTIHLPATAEKRKSKSKTRDPHKYLPYNEE